MPMRAVCQRGSQRAGLVWLGTLLYLVYAFVVYAVAVHFNYLFLVYVAALGLSAWAVILHANRLRGADMQYPPGRPLKVAAGVIIGIGVLFAGLWLSELVPALISGKVPVSLTEAGLWVNPIHVIDLSVVLPGFIVAGVAALQRREHGLFWLAPWLVFSALMGSSIIAAMVLMRMQASPPRRRQWRWSPWSSRPASLLYGATSAADPFQGLRRDTRCSHNRDRLRPSLTRRQEPKICGCRGPAPKHHGSATLSGVEASTSRADRGRPRRERRWSRGFVHRALHARRPQHLLDPPGSRWDNCAGTPPRAAMR